MTKPPLAAFSAAQTPASNHPRLSKLARSTSVLLLTLGMAPSALSQVYSVNAVGYVNVTLPASPRQALIANPLNSTNSHLNTILPLPDNAEGTRILRWNVPSQSFGDPIEFIAGTGWESSNPDPAWLVLSLGEGFYIRSAVASPLIVTFVGEVPQGSLTQVVPAGISYLASMVPATRPLGQAGAPGTHQFPAAEGDSVWLWDTASQTFTTYDFIEGFGWFPDDPVIGPAQGFVSQKTAPAVWTQNFVVNLAGSRLGSPAASLAIASLGSGNVRITWPASGWKLQESSNNGATWSLVPGNPTSPYVTPAIGARKFFRLVQACVAISCPANTNLTCSGPTGTPVVFRATATNTCTHSNISVSCTPTSGSPFLPGPTTVTCVATDSGETATCTFTVTVSDTQAPQIACPPAIIATAAAGQCSAIVNYTVTATDLCDASPQVTCVPPSGSTFELGTKTVNCQATDDSGNSASCNFHVTINAFTNCGPASCPTSYSIVVTAGFTNLIANQLDTGGNTLNEVLPNVPDRTVLWKYDPCLQTYSDALTFLAGAGWFDASGDPSSATLAPGEGAFLQLPGGHPQMTLTFTGRRRCARSLPTCNARGYQIISDQLPEAGDFATIVGVPPVDGTVVYRMVGGFYEAYSYMAGLGWLDPTNGPVAPTAEKGEAWWLYWPTPCLAISCPTNQVLACVGSGGTPATFAASATNTCCTNASLPVVCTPPSGAPFPVGINTVTCVATQCGETSRCSFTITVLDPAPPRINCPQAITATTAAGQCSATVTFTVTATDLCDASPTVTCVPPSGSTFALGTRTVNCQATDDSGNSDSCSFTVTVNPFADCGPDSCPTSYTITVHPGVTNLIANHLDNGGNTLNEVLPDVPLGAVFYQWDAVAQSWSFAEFFGAGVGWMPGTMTFAPGDGAFLNVPGPASVQVTFTGRRRCARTLPICRVPEYQIISDQLPEPGTFASIVGGTPADGTVVYRMMGGLYVPYTYTEGMGWEPEEPVARVGEAWFLQWPSPCLVMDCPKNQELTCACPTGAQAFFAPQARNLCAPGAVTVTCTPPSGSVFPFGTNAVICVATDARCGYRASCTFTVTVRCRYTAYVPEGDSMIGNNLDHPPNDLPTLFNQQSAPGLRTGTKISVLNVAQTGYEDVAFWTGENWQYAPGQNDFTLQPGEGVWIRNPGPAFCAQFEGFPRTGPDVPLRPGFNLRSSRTCGRGLPEDVLGLSSPQDGTTVYLWDYKTQSYGVVSSYLAGFGWFPEWQLSPGQALFASAQPGFAGQLAASPLAVPPGPLPPCIQSITPQSLTVERGQNASFTVTDTCGGPKTYQWYRNSLPLPGSPNSATLTLTGVQPTDAGEYFVVIYSGRGLDASPTATLSVDSEPVITSQPSSRTVEAGQSTTLEVGALGKQPLGYQWWRGTNAVKPTGEVAGATSRVLAFVPFDTGFYWAVVSNALGKATSSVAVVSVTGGPQPQGMPVGLVGWWTGDDGDNHGGMSSNRVCTTHATPLGGVSFPYGQCSNTFALDGQSGHLVVSNFNYQFTNFTFMFWMKIHSFTDPYLMSPLGEHGTANPVTDFDDHSLQGWTPDTSGGPFQGELDVTVGAPAKGYAMRARSTSAANPPSPLITLAPARFRGDLSLYTRLAWDEFHACSPDSTAARSVTVHLVGANGTCYTNADSALPVNDLWTSRAVALSDPSQWGRHSNHPGAAANNPFEAVRQNVQALLLEFKPASAGDEARVDNIRLGPHAPQGFGFYTGNAPGNPAVGLYGVWSDGDIFDLRSAVPLSTHQWIHVAVTYDGQTNRQYFDGRLQLEQRDPGKTLTTSSLEIGKGYDTVDDVPTYFDGMVDEVCVLHRALASFEIRNIYSAGSSGLAKRPDWQQWPEPAPNNGPMLNISYDGRRVLLDWPQGPNSYRILTSDNILTPAINWNVLEPSAVPVIGCRHFMALEPQPGRSLYFRLRNP